MGPRQHECYVRPSLKRFPALCLHGTKRKVIRDSHKHKEKQGGPEASKIGKTSPRGLQLHWMQPFKEVQPFAPAKMNRQADCRMQDGQLAGPDTHTGTQIEAVRIRS